MPEKVYVDGSLTRLCYMIGNHPPRILHLHTTITSNQAEYAALIAAILDVQARGIRSVAFYSDSELMVNQINGRSKVNHPVLYRQCFISKALLSDFPDWTLTYVPREKNVAGRILEGKEPKLEKTAVEVGNYTGLGIPVVGGTGTVKI